MGWDSWDTFSCNVNQWDIEQVAYWLVASGMRDAGYRYVIIDDCWFNPTRAPDGSVRADGKKFPNGMRWLGWYLHSHGLLFGIYESAGPSTCAQLNSHYPGSTGSLGHEEQDARTFASWGVDYLKFDWCSRQTGLHNQIVEFTKMRDALRATGRPIVYSINPNSFQNTPTGASYNWSSIANMVRIGPDVAPFWDTGPLSNWFGGVVNSIEGDAPLWGRAGPGHWNDPDILAVGLDAERYAATVQAQGLDALLNPPLGGPQDALTFQGIRSNFAMWAMMAAPLIVGYDVRYLPQEVRRILLNRWLIEIDQDPLGIQGHPAGGDHEVWAKPLDGGAVAAALFNPSEVATRTTTTAGQLGLPPAWRYSTLNVWKGNVSATTGSLHYVVPAHGVVVYLVAPVPKPPPPKKKKPPHK
jgi:alpha-galactosidase